MEPSRGLSPLLTCLWYCSSVSKWRWRRCLTRLRAPSLSQFSSHSSSSSQSTLQTRWSSNWGRRETHCNSSTLSNKDSLKWVSRPKYHVCIHYHDISFKMFHFQCLCVCTKFLSLHVCSTYTEQLAFHFLRYLEASVMALDVTNDITKNHMTQVLRTLTQQLSNAEQTHRTVPNSAPLLRLIKRLRMISERLCHSHQSWVQLLIAHHLLYNIQLAITFLCGHFASVHVPCFTYIMWLSCD